MVLQEPQGVRLRLQQTWGLQTSEEPVRSAQLLEQRRLYTALIRCDPGPRKSNGKGSDSEQEEESRGWITTSIQGEQVCDRLVIWCLPRRHPQARCRILYAESSKDRGICIRSCHLRKCVIQDAMGRPNPLHWRTPANEGDRRVVELEYQVLQTFQTASALRKCTQATLQDDDGQIAQSILDDIRHAEAGGLLRPVQGQAIRLDPSGRIQGPEEASRPERMVTGRRDEHQEEGSTVLQETEPADDNPGELADTHSLQEHESGEVGPNDQQTPDDQSQFAHRHKRLRRCLRLDRSPNHEGNHSSFWTNQRQCERRQGRIPLIDFYGYNPPFYHTAYSDNLPTQRFFENYNTVNLQTR